MSFNWINPDEFSICSLLLMDEYIVKSMAKNENADFQKNLAVVLKSHPAILWYVQNKAPSAADRFDELAEQITRNVDHSTLRKAENYIIDNMDWAIVYVFPEYMEQLKYIKYWDESRLLSMTDFSGKAVLDVGAGTGRLTFAAAKAAQYVYACEPVERLRKYMREKQRKNNIQNVYVVDGVIESLPFRDGTFDIVMSGYTMGDDYKEEYNELSRVAKGDGCIIDCPGEDDRNNTLSKEMKRLGFKHLRYESKTGGVVYRYIKHLSESSIEC